MATFFKDKSALKKLRNRDFRSLEEKLELLENLEQSPPDSRECIALLSNADENVRETAARILRRTANEETLELIFAELRKKGSTRNYIIPLLPKIQPQGIFYYLNKAISSSELQERSFAVDLAIKFPSVKEFTRFFAEAIKDPEEEIRFKAINKLCKSANDKAVFPLLVSLLEDESNRIRHQIIDAMAKISNPALIEPFFNRLPLEPRHIKEKIVSTLSRLVKEYQLEIANYVFPVLGDQNKETRDAAAKLLAEIPNQKELVKKFLIYTRGSAVWIRGRMYDALNSVSGKIAEIVIELLAEEDEQIRNDAMYLATHLRSPKIIPGMIFILEKDDIDWWMHVLAIDMLIALKAEELPALLKRHHQNPDLICAVANAYQQRNENSPEAISFLREALEHSSNAVRRTAVRALNSYRQPEFDEWLQYIGENEPDWVLRTETRNLLEARGITCKEYVPANELDPEVAAQELHNMGIQMEDHYLNAIVGIESDQETESQPTLPISSTPSSAKQPAPPQVADKQTKVKPLAPPVIKAPPAQPPLATPIAKKPESQPPLAIPIAKEAKPKIAPVAKTASPKDQTPKSPRVVKLKFNKPKGPLDKG